MPDCIELPLRTSRGGCPVSPIITTFLLVLSGCASIPPDSAPVEKLLSERSGLPVRWQQSEADMTAARTRADQLLTEPLSADAAVEIVLTTSPGLQARLADLGIARADLAQSGQLANPGFGYKNTVADGTTTIERGLSFNLAAMILAPVLRKAEARRFDQTRLGVADDVLKLARDTRIAWAQAVAARQAAARLEKLTVASEGAAMIAEGMARQGNFSRLEQSRESLRHAETTWQAQRARDTAQRRWEALVRLLGLGTEAARLKLPDALPELPATVPEPGDVETIALERRIDVQAARGETSAVAESLGLTRTTRFINLIEAGPVRTTQGGGPRESGYELRLEVPLFDWGSARVARAEALYMKSVQQLAATATHARSAAREAWAGYRLARETALHYRDQILPLRRTVSNETLKHYNGMLISVFDLLADSREDTAIAIDAINAAADAWTALAELEYALGGSLPKTAAEKEKNHD
jgi:outer membrane protein TolC